MGYYNVIQACVVGKLHYLTPTTQPIEVDDAVAEPLVAEGCLEPYNPGGEPAANRRLANAQERADRAAADHASAVEQGERAASEFTEAIKQGVAGERPDLPAAPPRPRRGRRSES